MATFFIPSNAALKLVEQDLIPRLQANRPIFDILPIENEDDDLIMWEQEDNYIGLQQIRGLNGQPNRVKKVGVSRFIMQPGYYGEQSDISEMSLTRKRMFGTFGTAIDLSDLVTTEQKKLLQRELDRIEYIGWTLLTKGIFSVSNESGAVVHTDQFATQTFTAAITWATLATATPLADMRQIKLLHRGHSVRFDRSSKLYVNQTTLNAFLNNTNANDIGGKRKTGGATANLSMKDIDEIMSDNDLPMLVGMDDGYYDDNNVFQLFIPNFLGVLVGNRTTGTPIGSYVMTRNANNPDLGPGAYSKVVDLGEMEVPRRIVVHKGHNGGPKLPLPSGIVNCTL